MEEGALHADEGEPRLAERIDAQDASLIMNASMPNMTPEAERVSRHGSKVVGVVVSVEGLLSSFRTSRLV